MDGNPVEAWQDESGQANHVNQVEETRLPVYKTNVLNGQPVVRFDGADDFLASAGYQTGEALTVFFVCARPWNVASYRAVFAKGYGAAPYPGVAVYQVGGAFEDWQPKDIVVLGNGYPNTRYPRAVGAPGLLVDGTFYIVAVQLGAALSRFWLNGAVQSVIERTAAVPVDTNPFTIGAKQGGRDHWDGDIAEVIYYDRALTVEEMAQVEQYLATKYGIALA
ncbi:MAG: LamG-like jellyroll fold domain-containing protein [Candidatus Methylomirabilales bacterium]